VRGHRLSQARVVVHAGDEEILTVNAALGRRETPLTGQWARRPDVPAHGDSAPRELGDHHRGTISDRLEMKIAALPDDANGSSSLWIRLPGGLPVTASSLAIIGDFVPFGIGQAVGKPTGSNSLDNTVRIARLVPTEWVLADVRVHAVADGFGHGLVHLWAEDGTLLGSASQSAVVRLRADEVPHQPQPEFGGGNHP
jgi:acyl-CoA thioesterase II